VLVAEALGEASANDGGLVRKPEKKYAYPPSDPSATNATTEAIGIQTLRDMLLIVCQRAYPLL
jgi:hypothetical protein